MSTSIIYHGFGAVNYHYKRTEYQHGVLYFRIRKREKKCSCCGSFAVIQKGRWNGKNGDCPCLSRQGNPGRGQYQRVAATQLYPGRERAKI